MIPRRANTFFAASIKCAWIQSVLLLSIVLCCFQVANAQTSDSLHDEVSTEPQQPAHLGATIPCPVADVALEPIQTWSGTITDVLLVDGSIYVGMSNTVAVLNANSPNNVLLAKQSLPLGGVVSAIEVVGEYLFVAAGTGGAVILERNTLRQVASVPLAADQTTLYIRDVAAQGSRLYLVNGESEVQIYDIIKPTRPKLLGLYTSSTEIASIVVNDANAFLQKSLGSFDIVDIRVPESPTLVANYHGSGPLTVNGEFLYVIGFYGELEVYNISNPIEPKWISSLSVVASAWDAFVHKGQYLYLTDSDWDDVLTLDIADPTQPKVITTANVVNSAAGELVPNAEFTLRNVENILVSYDSRHITFFDLSIPSAPRPIGEFTPTISQRLVSLQDGLLYTVDIGSSSILDVSVPTNPQRLELETFKNPQMIAPFGRYVLVRDAVGLHIVDKTGWRPIGYTSLSLSFRIIKSVGAKIYGLNFVSFTIVDATNPTQPSEIASIELSDDQAQVDLAIVGQFAYVFSATGILTVIDVTSPTQPKIVTTIETGVTGVAIAVQGKYLLLAGEDELIVASLNSPAAPALINTHFWSEGRVTSFAVAETRGYAVTDDERILIVDIADPSQPFETGNYPLFASSSGSSEPNSDIEPTSVLIGGSHLYVSDSKGSINLLRQYPSASKSFTTTTQIEFSPCNVLTIGVDQTGVKTTAVTTPTVKLTYRQLDSLQHLPLGDRIDLLPPFDVQFRDEADSIQSDPTQSITLTLRYRSILPAEADEQTVRLYYWDGSQWLPEVENTTDVSTTTLIAHTPLRAAWRLAAEPRVAQAKLFLPKLVDSTPGISLIGFEATQGMQTLSNQVPLVARRPTTLRLYAESTEGFVINDFMLTLTATRDGELLIPAEVKVGPRAIFPKADRTSYKSTFDILLPAEWTVGNVQLHVLFSHEHGNYSSTTHILPLNFIEVPPLELTIVPVIANGIAPDQESITKRIIQLFPISAIHVSMHAPIRFDQTLSTTSDWQSLLSLIQTLKNSEDQSAATVYYGLVPDEAVEGFTSGYGSIGFRTSAGINYGDTAAHEIGHNFGRRHAPCGDPVGVDPLYPYEGASIGDFGYIPLSSEILLPNQYVDVMSYCNPKWVSDYTYSALLADQLKHGVVQQATTPSLPILMVRAVYQDEVNATLLPTYSFIGTPTSPPLGSDFHVRFLDAKGDVLAEHLVELHHAEEHGITLKTINALLPLPEQAATQVQLTYQGVPIATRNLQGNTNNIAPLQLVLENDTLTATWRGDEIPALIRYSHTRGGPTQTLAVDVTDDTFAIATNLLPGGEGFIEVLLADQLLGNAVTSHAPATIRLPDKPPTVWITGPTLVGSDQPIILYGHGYDLEDGVLETLQWYWGENLIASGQMLQLLPSQLLTTPNGNLMISLVVTDSGGHTSSVTHTVTLQPQSARE